MPSLTKRPTKKLTEAQKKRAKARFAAAKAKIKNRAKANFKRRRTTATKKPTKKTA